MARPQLVAVPWLLNDRGRNMLFIVNFPNSTCTQAAFDYVGIYMEAPVIIKQTNFKYR